MCGNQSTIFTLFRTAENNSDWKWRNTFQRKRQKDQKAKDDLFQFAAPGIKSPVPADSIPGVTRARGTGCLSRAHTDTGEMWTHLHLIVYCAFHFGWVLGYISGGMWTQLNLIVIYAFLFWLSIITDFSNLINMLRKMMTKKNLMLTKLDTYFTLNTI